MVSLSAWRARLNEVKPVEDRRSLGIGLVLMSLMLFTALDTSAKFLVTAGIPAQQLVFVRYGVHLFLVLSILLPLQGRSLVRTRRPVQEVVRALMLLMATATNFIAVLYLPLTTTSSILFSMPLILCVLSVPFLGEHVGWRRWLAVVVGLVGVLIIIQPGGASFHWAMLISFGSALALAVYNVFNRKLAGIDSVNTQQFYAGLVATVAIAPFAFGDWVWPQDGLQWTVFLSLGLLGGVGHMMLTTAHRMAEASVLAPFTYTQIIFMTISSLVVFGQAPDIWIYIGAPIVIGSGLYIWLRERRLELKARRTEAPHS